MNMVSDNKPDQDDQGSFKDYKNGSINQIIRKTQDSKLTLPPLGVKSDSQPQQHQLSPPQPQQQADYTYSSFQSQPYDPYRQMSVSQPQPQSQAQSVQLQQPPQQQQPTYASPSQYPIPQQSFSIANPSQYHPQAYGAHTEYHQQQIQLQMQQSLQQQQAQQQAAIQQAQVGVPQSQHTILADSKRGRRFRRRYNQIVRKYPCSFPGCIKSYGSLNHLNTHIVTKKHGHRKSKVDFQHSLQPKEPGANKSGELAQYAQTGSEYTAGNYWYGYSTHLGRSPSQADSFTQQQTTALQNNNNNYMYFQGYQQTPATANSTNVPISQSHPAPPPQQQQPSQQQQQQYIAQLQAPTVSSIPQQRMVMGSVSYYQQPQQPQQIPQYYAPPQLQQQQQQSQLINTDGTSRVPGLDDNKQNQPGI